MSTYTKSLSSDFSGSLKSHQFHDEIVSEAGITPNLIGVMVTGDVVDIKFDSALSAGEQTTLNTVISNHTPTVTINSTEFVSGSYQLATTSRNYYTITTLTTSSLSEESSFKITWYYEYSFYEGEFECRIIVDDTTEIGHICWAPYVKTDNGYTWSENGFKKIVLGTGVHTVKIQYRMPNGGSGRIKNANIDIE